jgi:hypothetical protein
MQRDDQRRVVWQAFGSVGEHTKIARIGTEPEQFSQLCRAAQARWASASRILSGRRKKAFEFASK